MLPPAVTSPLLLTRRRSQLTGKSKRYSLSLILTTLCYSMGAKVQTENTKLVVPGAGAYESTSKVSS